ncbi:hypothetical protein CFN78_16280 [Amycolatopsis antarctica]|uniref:PucR C-terminal helix-turn-helix domain-containing protein n=1 Tax=Amycolatopsis antarctica TaxID=1854586 RepID=A0A263D0Y5_9PSEU|nr:helix-turn-helix domain-containing protein [Amycolatopsis antarctica]OZM72100.1 hypothetical protein CFN78_16280 [Amycolatopsis antarctica]
MEPSAHGSAGGDRTDDLRTLTRLATRPDAVEAILGWLARRVGGAVTLLGTDGEVVAPAPSRPGRQPPAGAVDAVAGLCREGTPSTVLIGDGQEYAVHLVRLGREDSPPYLVARTGARDCGDLLADAARVLGPCSQVAEAARERARVETADAQTREAVLHLLMIGAVSAARRIATTLRPSLPDPARVHVVEGPRRGLSAVASRMRDATGARAWIVPCPVRPSHLIALAPVARGDAGDPVRLARALVAEAPGYRVGVSDVVPLRDAATGYEQAFHALAVARGAPERYAGVGGRADLVPFLGMAGHGWAREVLHACVSFTPARRADPGGGELLDTLNSWLTFDNAASRHLRIHRNTLASRVRLLGRLLGLDLDRVGDRAAAWLALRLYGERASRELPGPLVAAEGAVTADTTGDTAADTAAAERMVVLRGLLTEAPVRAWAGARLRPLEHGGPPGGLDTVRAWLAADTRLPGTATALGLSLPGVRKRLVRAEEVLGCSLLRAPSSKYELWLAMRALGHL